MIRGTVVVTTYLSEVSFQGSWVRLSVATTQLPQGKEEYLVNLFGAQFPPQSPSVP